MKSLKFVLLSGCILGLAAVDLAAQEQEKPAWFFAGPRIGVTGVVTPQWRFDRQIQEIRSRDLMYFPVYSEIGINLDQHMRLGPGSTLLFRETALIGGLDQNVVLPSLTALVGLGWDFGLEVLVGPDLSRDASGGDPEPTLSLAVAVGWVFHAWGRPIPVSVVVVPLSVDWEPRITALAGIDFPIRIRIPEKKQPFNY